MIITNNTHRYIMFDMGGVVYSAGPGQGIDDEIYPAAANILDNISKNIKMFEDEIAVLLGQEHPLTKRIVEGKPLPEE